MMSDAALTYRGTVYPWQCDHVGHMNVMWYTGKFDEATWNLMALIGVTPSFLRNEGRGMAALEQKTSYRRELLPGDTVVVRSSIAEVREKAMRFVHEMTNGETGDVVAVSELVVVHMDRAARRSCALPPAVAERARAMIGPPGAVPA